jgi:hypothetical protein
LGFNSISDDLGAGIIAGQVAATALEYYQAWRSGNPVDTGDIQLGEDAATLGALFKAGVVERGDLAQTIKNDFCSK